MIALLNLIKEKVIKYKKVIILCLVIKITILLVVLCGKGLMPTNTKYALTNYTYPNKGTYIENSLSPYDGQRYLGIAELGYAHSQDNSLFASYPLYPLLMRTVGYIFFNNLYFSGLLISFIFSILGSIYLFKLFRLDENEQDSMQALFYFFIYPAAIVFSSVYNESLFLFLTASSIYYARREKWWASCLIAMLGALTRPQGILLLAPIAIEYYLYLAKNNLTTLNRQIILKTKWSFLALALIPLGQIAYFTYALIVKNDFWLPMKIQSYWGRRPVNPMNIVQMFENKIFNINSIPIHDAFSSKIDLLFTVIFLILLIPMIKRIRISYVAYSFFLIVVPLATGSTMSMMRYLALSFPHFIYFGRIGTKYKYADTAITVIFIMLMAIMSLRFVNWRWLG